MKLMMGTPEGPKAKTTTDEIFKGKKVVLLFAAPRRLHADMQRAKHLPGFVQNVDAIKAKEVSIRSRASLSMMRS